MNETLHLTVSTPTAILVDDASVRSVRAEDLSGGFGILPGHANLLTALPASVVRWRTADDTERYCAVRGGVLTVRDGQRVSIACRKGVLGDDLDELEEAVRGEQAEETDAERRSRVEQTRLHARAVRLLMRYLHPQGRRNSPQPDRVPADEAENG